MSLFTPLHEVLARCRQAAAGRGAAGQGMAEYGLIMSIVSVASLLLLMSLGGSITAFLSSIGAAL